MFEQSNSARRFIGQITPGEDVVDAILKLCDANDVESGFVTLSGTVSAPDLVRFVADGQKYVSILNGAGRANIVAFRGVLATLGGQPALRGDAVLAMDGPAGQQVVFGQLRSAAAEDCEFVVDAPSDITIGRAFDAATGRFPIKSVVHHGGARPVAEPAPAPAPAAPRATERRPAAEPIVEPMPTSVPDGEEKSSLSWADAIDAGADAAPADPSPAKPPREVAKAKSAEEVYVDYDFNAPIVGPGDILDHPKLGECRVIKVEEDEYAHIRLSRGQIRKLALEVVELVYAGERDGKNLFKVRVRK